MVSGGPGTKGKPKPAFQVREESLTKLTRYFGPRKVVDTNAETPLDHISMMD